jgi:hypothetical protein
MASRQRPARPSGDGLGEWFRRLASHDNNRRRRARHPNNTENIERITSAFTEIQIQKDKVDMLESRGEDRIVRGGPRR